MSVEGVVYAKDDEGFDIGDGEDVHVGDARVRIVPDAGAIDLLDTMDAVDSEVMGVAEVLFHERPDLIEVLESGGDLLVLSSLWIDPKFRGDETGHTVLKAILGGRAAALVVLQGAPVLKDDGPKRVPRSMRPRRLRCVVTGLTSASRRPPVTTCSLATWRRCWPKHGCDQFCGRTCRRAFR